MVITNWLFRLLCTKAFYERSWCWFQSHFSHSKCFREWSFERVPCNLLLSLWGLQWFGFLQVLTLYYQYTCFIAFLGWQLYLYGSTFLGYVRLNLSMNTKKILPIITCIALASNFSILQIIICKYIACSSHLTEG